MATAADTAPAARAPDRGLHLERLAPVGLFVVVAAASVIAAYYGFHAHMVQPDETLTVIYGRAVELSPHKAIEYDGWPRGPERLPALVFALVGWLVSDTARQFQVVHVVLAVGFALTAIPVHAVARRAGLTRAWALLPALLAVVGPWTVFGISLLNTGTGYLTSTALLLAMLIALLRPGVPSDAGVVVALVATALARTGDIPFVLALVPAVLVQTWRDRPAGTGATRWLRQLPLTLLRRHRLLSALALVIVVVALAVGGNRFTGPQYQTGILPGLGTGAMLDGAADIAARLTTGTLIIPAVFALPWLLRAAVAPRRREEGAFAVLTIAFALAFVYFYAGRNEDRYTLMLVPVVLIPFAHALAVRRVPPLAVAVSAVLVARLVATRGLFADDGSFGFFVSPGSQFLRRIVIGRLSEVIPFGVHGPTVLTLAAGAVAFVLAVAAGRGGAPWTVVLGFGTAGLVVLSVVAGMYAPHRLVVLASPKVSFAQQTFVDRAANGRPVALLDENPGADYGRVLSAGDLSFFNTSLKGSIRPDGQFSTACCSPYYFRPVVAAIDRATGSVSVGRSHYRLIAVPTGYTTFGLSATTIARSPAFPYRVDRLAAGLARLSYAVENAANDGFGRPGTPVRVRTFPRNVSRGRTCLTMSVTAPQDLPRDLRYTVRSGAGSVSGQLSATLTRAVRVPLRAGRVDVVRVRTNRSGRSLDGRTSQTVGLSDIAVTPCR